MHTDRLICLHPGFFLHAFFEGYFVLYHSSLAGSQSLFAQLWKEYALSDSRYMTSDPFMLCIETITVVRRSDLPLKTLELPDEAMMRTC